MRELEATGQKLRFTFFRSVIAELKKVSWPSREETTRLTAIVLAVTAALALILWGIDTAFTKLIDFLLLR